MHGCGEEQGGRRPAETVSLSSRHGMLRRHARWRLPSPLFVTSASGRADCVLTWELRLLAMERECQAGNNEGQEKDWQDALSATSERDGFAHGGVEGLGSVGVSAVAGVARCDVRVRALCRWSRAVPRTRQTFCRSLRRTFRDGRPLRLLYASASALPPSLISLLVLKGVPLGTRRRTRRGGHGHPLLPASGSRWGA